MISHNKKTHLYREDYEVYDRRLHIEEVVSFSELGRKYGIDRKTAARIVKEGA